MSAEENFENSNTEMHTCNCTKFDGWIKFIMMTLAVGLGTFLAVYFVADQAMTKAFYYAPMPHHFEKKFDKIMRENDLEMQRLEKNIRKNHERVFMELDSQLEPITDLREYDKGYKLIINLKHFNNDINNIKLDITPDKISILGQNEKDDKNSIYSLNYSQTYKLDEKINAKGVTKEVAEGKAIVYLPFLD